jgi:NAD(P)-dependent dehydrogenase (short-subunit alcohol dehydrogenase family)
MGQLEGKNALILGASTRAGIGEATASRFVAEGAHVIVTARRRPELESLAASIGAVPMECDITDEAQLEALMKRAFELKRRLDVLMIVAGAHAAAPVDQLTREMLLTTYESRRRGCACDQACRTRDGPRGLDHLRFVGGRFAQHVRRHSVRLHEGRG